MNLKEKQVIFEKSFNLQENAILTFKGIDGYDVYNCSIPFECKEKFYIYGRVEKPNEWARSRTMLFENTTKDVWTRVTNSMIYQIEDPNIALINGKIVLGGPFVYFKQGVGVGFNNMFYQGTDLEDMYYFTMGPRDMKDIRLVELPEGKIGIFSRPRGQEIYEKFGCRSAVGFTTINSLGELDDEVIENAPYIEGLFGNEEWGGANQAYYLESGLIGVIGHKSYKVDNQTEVGLHTYLTVAFVFNPDTHSIVEDKIIATRESFPEFRAKKPHIMDCTFPSGIVMRNDSKCDLYSGISDAAEGRTVIDYPFEGYGKIVSFGGI